VRLRGVWDFVDGRQTASQPPGIGSPDATKSIMELNSSHPGHLHVSNYAGHAAAALGFHKVLGAFKRHCCIAQRPDEASESLSHRMIVIDDRYDGFPWQIRSLMRTGNNVPVGFRHCTSVGSDRQKEDRRAERLIAIILAHRPDTLSEGLLETACP
jgi:hypothetical protein